MPVLVAISFKNKHNKPGIIWFFEPKFAIGKGLNKEIGMKQHKKKKAFCTPLREKTLRRART